MPRRADGSTFLSAVSTVALLCMLVLVLAPPAPAHRGDGVFRLAEGGWIDGVWGIWLAPDPAMLTDGRVIMVAEERSWLIGLDGRRSLIPGLGGTGVAATPEGG